MKHFTPCLAILTTICLIYTTPIIAAETFTDASCNAVTATMTSCARRWDAIRQNCTNSYGSNTVWPGPCECSYYANDLPCFDEQATCADQIWTQVPQWFRDGVTSCLMKDASYTIRAQLGTVENPFSITGLAGNATRTTASSSGAAQTGSLPNAVSATTTPITNDPAPRGLDNGAKIGIGVGIGIGVPILSFIIAFIVIRRSRGQKVDAGEELEAGEKYEVHGKDAKIFEAGSDSNLSKSELAGVMGVELEGEKGVELVGEWGHEMVGDMGRHGCGNGPRHEMETSANIAELPVRRM
ncbi:hypothetical protein ACN47E_001415 [Coniothyrium glycines]